MATRTFNMSLPDKTTLWPTIAEAGVRGGKPAVSAAMRLTRRMARGEEEAYREFHELYCNRLFRYLLVITRGDEQAAQDALQETCIRVTRYVRAFDSEDAFWSWLTVLARSASRDGGRRQKRHWQLMKRYAAFMFRQNGPSEIQASAPDENELRLTMWTEQALDVLSPLDRALMQGKYLEKLSVKELANERQLSEKAVESRLLRARRQIKEVVLGQLKTLNEREP